ncbi:hypothetical protein JTE90_012680 [Oedothorax gibbosus]|uniref:Uncharacterized protein n=1 Tax=Oedothorax gibbosus TaxID=931172 RepID=A0AAV6VZS4_9ARAC|nr:hypothetical protein JTE90_012680 [Oedothorax gibbosus]
MERDSREKKQNISIFAGTPLDGACIACHTHCRVIDDARFREDKVHSGIFCNILGGLEQGPCIRGCMEALSMLR